MHLLTRAVAHHLLHLRKTQRTLSGLQHVKRLDSPLASRPRRPWKQRIRLAPLRTLDRSPIISLLPRHPRGLELKEQQLRQNSRSIGSSVQHVRASRQHRRHKHLPRRRPTFLHPWQQDSAGYLLLQHCFVLSGQVLLRYEE